MIWTYCLFILMIQSNWLGLTTYSFIFRFTFLASTWFQSKITRKSCKTGHTDNCCFNIKLLKSLPNSWNWWHSIFYSFAMTFTLSSDFAIFHGRSNFCSNLLCLGWSFWQTWSRWWNGWWREWWVWDIFTSIDCSFVVVKRGHFNIISFVGVESLKRVFVLVRQIWRSQ